MEENTYLPPVKSVRLDIGQKQDDGKLENCLIQLHRVTRNVAQKWITDYTNDINQALAEAGFMDLGTMGRLVYADNVVSFEACEAGVNSPEWYGLDSFQMPKLPAYAHKHNGYKDPTHFTIRLRRSTVHRVMTAAAMYPKRATSPAVTLSDTAHNHAGHRVLCQHRRSGRGQV